jgi:hypothetical protein
VRDETAAATTDEAYGGNGELLWRFTGSSTDPNQRAFVNFEGGILAEYYGVRRGGRSPTTPVKSPMPAPTSLQKHGNSLDKSNELLYGYEPGCEIVLWRRPCSPKAGWEALAKTNPREVYSAV